MAVNEAVFKELEAKYPAGTLVDSSSVPTSQLLYALAKLVRPCRVVEIGTFHGATSAWLARAVAENGYGDYVGYEINPDNARITRAVLEEACPGGKWIVHQRDIRQEPYVEADFVFMDHAKQLYMEATQKLMIPVGGYLCAHDTASWPEAVHFGRWMQVMPGWESINIQQERGLMIARRLA